MIERLNSGMDSRDVRESAGPELLKLLSADYFASFVWDAGTQRFTDSVFLNMDPGNLERYDSYYQYRNPISHKARSFRRAVCVNEFVPQRELVKTEFYNDFLARDGLYYGMNLYAFNGDQNVGDLRIWRNRRRNNFDANDLEIMEIIKPHFYNAMRNILHLAGRPRTQLSHRIELTNSSSLDIEYLMTRFRLTRREAEIALEIASGKPDQKIAAKLGIAFSTLRTHIRNLYAKLGTRSRTALAHKICTPP